MKKRKTKKYSVGQLKRLADNWFSKYVRYRDNGMCITCGKKFPVKKLQAGHFVSRVHNSTRFNEKNVHAQCMRDNFFHEGVKDEYALRLIEMYGLEVLYELNRLKKIPKEFTRDELWGIIKEYEYKLKQLRRRKPLFIPQKQASDNLDKTTENH